MNLRPAHQGNQTALEALEECSQIVAEMEHFMTPQEFAGLLGLPLKMHLMHVTVHGIKPKLFNHKMSQVFLMALNIKETP